MEERERERERERLRRVSVIRRGKGIEKKRTRGVMESRDKEKKESEIVMKRWEDGGER